MRTPYTPAGAGHGATSGAQQVRPRAGAGAGAQCRPARGRRAGRAPPSARRRGSSCGASIACSSSTSLASAIGLRTRSGRSSIAVSACAPRPRAHPGAPLGVRGMSGHSAQLCNMWLDSAAQRGALLKLPAGSKTMCVSPDRCPRKAETSGLKRAGAEPCQRQGSAAVRADRHPPHATRTPFSGTAPEMFFSVTLETRVPPCPWNACASLPSWRAAPVQGQRCRSRRAGPHGPSAR